MRMTGHRNSVGYDLVETDVDGIGKVLCSVNQVAGPLPLVEHAARLLIIAHNMPGGWERAIEMCRAESAKHQ